MEGKEKYFAININQVAEDTKSIGLGSWETLSETHGKIE